MGGLVFRFFLKLKHRKLIFLNKKYKKLLNCFLNEGLKALTISNSAFGTAKKYFTKFITNHKQNSIIKHVNLGSLNLSV